MFLVGLDGERGEFQAEATLNSINCSSNLVFTRGGVILVVCRKRYKGVELLVTNVLLKYCESWP